MVRRIVLKASLSGFLLVSIAVCAAWAQEDPQSILAALPSPGTYADEQGVCLLLESSIEPEGVPAGGVTTWRYRMHVRLWLTSEDLARTVENEGVVLGMPCDAKVRYARVILPSGDAVPGYAWAWLDSTIPQASGWGVGAPPESEQAARRIVRAVIEDSYSRGSMIWPLPVTFPGATIGAGAVVDYEVAWTVRLPADVLWGESPLFPGGSLASRHTVAIPEGQELRWKLVGDASLRVSKDGPSHTFETLRTPAAPAYEPGSPCGYADAPAIIYSTASSWSAAAAAERLMLRDPLPDNTTLQAQTARVLKRAATREEKIESILAYARDVVANGMDSTWDRNWAASSRATIDENTGDCKAKTALVVSMLRIAGIEAYPALMSTGCRLRGVEDTNGLFGPWQMDHVVVAVPAEDAGWQVLDPTCQDCVPLGGKTVWILDGAEDSAGSFYTIPWASEEQRTVACTLSGEVLATGERRFVGSSSVGSDFVQNYKALAEAYDMMWQYDLSGTAWLEEAGSLQPAWLNLLGQGSDWDAATVALEDGVDGTPSTVTYTRPGGPSCASECFVTLAGVPGPTRLPVGLPTAAEDAARKTPFETEPAVWTCTATLDLPPGGTVRAPSDVHLSAPGVTYDATYAWDGSRLSVVRRLVITTDTVAAEDYRAFAAVIAAVEFDNVKSILCSL